jgi:hypothetical protein
MKSATFLGPPITGGLTALNFQHIKVIPKDKVTEYVEPIHLPGLTSLIISYKASHGT